MVNTREVYHVPVAGRSEVGVRAEAGSALQLATRQDSAQQLLINQSSHGSLVGARRRTGLTT